MFIRILNSEMELATGCTEPGAVALTAAEAGQALRKAGVDKAEEITVNASINIIKNAMSAGIPGTDYEGMDYAAAIGALGGDPVYLLEVMNHVPRETVEAAAALVKAGKVRVNVAQVPQKLYIEVIAKGGGHTGRAIVRDLHTNVVLVEQDGVATLDKRDTDTAAAGDSDVVTPEQIASFLTVRSIWDYCTKELDPMNDPIDIIRSAVQVNSVISDEGLSKEYGLAIGRNLDLNCRKGLMTRDLTTNSMIAAAAGADDPQDARQQDHQVLHRCQLLKADDKYQHQDQLDPAARQKAGIPAGKAVEQPGDPEAGIIDPRLFAGDQQKRQHQQGNRCHGDEPGQHGPQGHQHPQRQFFCTHVSSPRYSSISRVNSLCWCL